MRTQGFVVVEQDFNASLQADKPLNTVIHEKFISKDGLELGLREGYDVLEEFAADASNKSVTTDE